MDYLKNHCWCRESNWGGLYNSEIVVSINSSKEDKDYENLTETLIYYSEKKFKEEKKYYEEEGIEITEKRKELIGKVRSIRLKPEVMKWLRENIKDTKKGKGWCVGSDDYNSLNLSCYSVFFQRRKDAMLFIKEWSEWKKPINYCQYFTDVRKKLNLKTLKYENR